MKKYQWTIVPSSLPAIIKNCPKCGGRSRYECSKNFRVNANKNHIDVWLIYQCQKCKTIRNMEILSRKDAKTIDKELYRKFLHNDPELAERYAFHMPVHNKNRFFMDYNSLTLEIHGDNFSLLDLEEAVEIEILCNYPLRIRLDKLLSHKLQVSREVIKKLADQHKICIKGGHDPGKELPSNGIILNILP